MKTYWWVIGLVLAASLSLGACGKKKSEIKPESEQSKKAVLEEELTKEETQSAKAY